MKLSQKNIKKDSFRLSRKEETYASTWFRTGQQFQKFIFSFLLFKKHQHPSYQPVGKSQTRFCLQGKQRLWRSCGQQTEKESIPFVQRFYGLLQNEFKRKQLESPASFRNIPKKFLLKLSAQWSVWKSLFQKTVVIRNNCNSCRFLYYSIFSLFHVWMR